jgi:hypothetical protein
MFAVDHAATALLIKRRFPSAPLPHLLLSVQAMELAWVALNYAGIERTTTEPVVRSVADVHLAYMPYSHSVATAAGGALIVWLVLEKGFRRATLGRAVGLGIVSHLVLDLLTHATDIVLYPGSSIALGAGLYDRAPMWGFALEMVYGLFCWQVFRGGRALLAVIVLGNLANLSLFSAAIPGPEQFLAGRPLALVTLILVQIVTTLVLVAVFAEPKGSTYQFRTGGRTVDAINPRHARFRVNLTANGAPGFPALAGSRGVATAWRRLGFAARRDGGASRGGR